MFLFFLLAVTCSFYVLSLYLLSLLVVLCSRFLFYFAMRYSRVLNKQGVRIMGNLEMVRYNNNRGAGIIEGGAWRNGK